MEVYPEYAEMLVRKLRGRREVNKTRLTPEDRMEFDLSDAKEWNSVLTEKNALRILTPQEAMQIRCVHPDRMIGARWGRNWKHPEESDIKMRCAESRFCLLGHQNPHLLELVENGGLSAPRVNRWSTMIFYAIAAAKKWILQSGDIKTAFLNSSPMDRKKKLYATPCDGIPRVPVEDPREVLTPMYGLNPAPSSWFCTLTGFFSTDWFQSIFDPCLWYKRDPKTGELTGITLLIFHVDDLCVCGDEKDTGYVDAVRKMRARFNFGSWKRGSAEFLPE